MFANPWATRRLTTGKIQSRFSEKLNVPDTNKIYRHKVLVYLSSNIVKNAIFIVRMSNLGQFSEKIDIFVNNRLIEIQI